MRILILSFILLVEIIIESTIFPFIKIWGATPDLILITIISLGLIYGKKEGIILGLIGGLLSDILFGRVIGLHSLPYMLIGYIIGILSERVFKENRLIPFILSVFSTILLHMGFYLLQYLRGIEFVYNTQFRNYTVISILLNAIIVVLVYPYFIKLSEWHVLKE